MTIDNTIKITEIWRRWANATPGPWTWLDGEEEEKLGCFMGDNGVEVCGFGDPEQYYPTEGTEPSPADVDFIGHAPEDIAFLLAEVKRLSK